MAEHPASGGGRAALAPPGHDLPGGVDQGPGRLDGAEARRWPARAAPWALFFLAALFRLFRLDARPLHHDEGTNLIFLLRLLKEGVYHYDPTNYHGPVLYYLGVVPLWICGMTETALRLTPAILGSLMAPLVWALRDRLGNRSALASAVLLAVSPCFVYYARDQIHETYLMFFTLLFVVALSRSLASPTSVRAGRLPRAGACVLAGAAAGAMLATKETAVASLAAILAGAWIAAVVDGKRARPGGREIAAALVSALVVLLLLVTGFLREPGGITAFLQAPLHWGQRGLHGEGHEKPAWYFLAVLAREEPWVMGASVAGLGLAMRRRRPSGIAAAVWMVTLLTVYSLLPYKTPWLVLNPLLPALLLAGLAFEAAQAPPAAPWRRRAAAGILGVAAFWSAARAVEVAILRPEIEGSSRLVYVQTDRDLLRLAARMRAYADRHSEGLALPVQILSPDYLPLNWYLRDFAAVGYWGRLIDLPGGDLIVAREDQAETVARRLGSGHTRETFVLRPGVRLVLFARMPDGPLVPGTPPE